MTPERVSGLILRWVRFYTRELPGATAQRRIEEISSDLSHQIQFEREKGVRESRIARNLLSRFARGMAADASWRGQQLAAAGNRKSLRRPVIGVLCVTGLLLLIPLLAMQFTGEVAWNLADFLVAGVLLGGTGLMLVSLIRLPNSTAYRLAMTVTLGTCLMLVWASLAVGIIGVDGDPADLMYAGVIGVGVVGATLARLRPAGMARTLLAMATSQLLIAGIALIAGKHHAPYSSAIEILAINGFFATLFLASASLFGLAAIRRSRGPDLGP